MTFVAASIVRGGCLHLIAPRALTFFCAVQSDQIGAIRVAQDPGHFEARFVSTALQTHNITRVELSLKSGDSRTGETDVHRHRSLMEGFPIGVNTQHSNIQRSG
jgi:hypothetical protein